LIISKAYLNLCFNPLYDIAVPWKPIDWAAA